MTEAEWLSCSDPDRMLSYLASQGEPDERRLRLVACACVRQAWHLLTPQALLRQGVSADFTDPASYGSGSRNVRADASATPKVD